MKIIKLFIADDHQILIDGLTSFLHEIDGLKVIGHANNGAMLLRELLNSKPDVILLDLNMPKVDGLATLEKLKKDHPTIKIIILSNYNQSQLFKEARIKGANGYLTKNGSKKELLLAIKTVMEGGVYFDTDEIPIETPVIKVFTDEFIKKYQLTKREIEIIKIICDGLNSREIAKKLFISEYTVNTHRRNVMAKLGIKNTAGLINFAIEQGIAV